MKSTPMTMLLLCLLGAFANCCKKDNMDSCPETLNLGSLQWSTETENWLPAKYLNPASTLRFESENGEFADFNMVYSETLEGHLESFYFDCPDGDSTRVSWRDIRYAAYYQSADSTRINVGIGVWNEKLALNDVVEPDYYEWVSVIVSKRQNGKWNEFGRVRIITDLRNSEREDIDHIAEYFQLLTDFNFMGMTYPRIYYYKSTDLTEPFICFEKGNGLIGYADENGTNWKLAGQ